MKRILKRIVKWTGVAILLLLLGLAVFLFISYWRSTNDCEQLAAAPGEKMKAIVYCDYGQADVLKLLDIAKPVPNDNQVLVRVRAAPSSRCRRCGRGWCTRRWQDSGGFRCHEQYQPSQPRLP